MRLTERRLKALPARDVDYFAWDDSLPGFGVRVHATGRRSYVLKFYVQAAGRSRRLTLGAVDDLTLADARTKAQRLRLAAREGHDPASDRQKARTAVTVAALGVDFLEDVEARRKAKTAAGYRSQWGRYVVPALGSRTVASVTRADVATAHRRIGRTHPVTANRVVALLGSFFAFAERSGVVASTPVRRIQRYREAGRERFLSLEEWTRLGDALCPGLTERAPAGGGQAPTARREASTEERRHADSRRPLRRRRAPTPEFDRATTHRGACPAVGGRGPRARDHHNPRQQDGQVRAAVRRRSSRVAGRLAADRRERSRLPGTQARGTPHVGAPSLARGL